MTAPARTVPQLVGLMVDAGLVEIEGDRHLLATLVGRARDLAHAQQVARKLHAAGCKVDVRSASDDESWVYVS